MKNFKNCIKNGLLITDAKVDFYDTYQALKGFEDEIIENLHDGASYKHIKEQFDMLIFEILSLVDRENQAQHKIDIKFTNFKSKISD